MTDPLTPTQAHERLDRYGWLADAQGPGVYSLRIAIPSDPKAVWSQEFDVAKAAWTEQLRAAERLLYVGEAHDIYSRIMDHCRGDVRQTAIMRVCPPVDVHGVWPVTESAAQRSAEETNKAVEFAVGETVTWCNGQLR